MKNKIVKILQLPYTFTLMNWAVLVGLFCFARGHESFWNLPHAAHTSTMHEMRRT